jgi:hypothetical protein
MMPLFRKIRKQLAEDNKALKYLKYAVGEIVLVVIGILIALQINTWNEGHKEKIRGQAHLKEIKAELLYDLKQWKKIMTDIEEVDQAGLYVNAFLANSLDTIDSVRLKDAYLRAGHLAVFSITDIAYNNLISSGEINLIENDSLKRQLGFLHNPDKWDKRYHDGPMLQIFNDYSNYINTHTEPLLVRQFFQKEFEAKWDRTFKITTVSLDHFSVNWNDVKADPQNHVLLDQVLANRVIQRGNYIDWKNEILVLLDNIDLALKN